jgi:lauroyl/myristoyl acyltransferase
VNPDLLPHPSQKHINHTHPTAMDAPPGRFWRSAAYFSAYGVSRLVPRVVGNGIADAAALTAHALKLRERAGVRNNLSAVLRQSPASSRVKNAARHVYLNFGRACAALLYETRDRKAGDAALPNLRFEGLHILDRAIAENNGVILASAHLGGWELGALALASRGYPLTALASPPAAGTAALYERHRERFGLKTLSVSTSVFRCISVLRQGGVLGVVADRRFGSAGLTANFFGRQTKLPQGPARLCARTGAPILAASLRFMQGDTKHPLLTIHGRIDAPAASDRTDSVLAIQQQLAELLESMIAESPEEWYCFEDMWPFHDKVGSS